MAQHPQNCGVCELIQQCEAGNHPGLIAELDNGWVVLGLSQYFEGYTLFLSKVPAPDLEDLAWPERMKLLESVALVSEAVSTAVQPHKMNVESLGNVNPHLHWHFFPRQLSEPEPLKAVWVVMPEGDAAKPYELDAERHGELKAKIRESLTALLVSKSSDKA